MSNLAPFKLSPRFDTLEKICINGRTVFFAVGMALDEIKREGYHKERGFTDFLAYCESIGYGRRYCNQLIIAAKVIEDLPAELRDLVRSERAARAIQALPSTLRISVVVKASEGGTKPITSTAVKRIVAAPSRPLAASEVKKAASAPPRPKVAAKLKREAIFDKVGIEVPVEIEKAWKSAQEIGTEILTYASHVRVQIKNAQGDSNFVFAEIDHQGSYANMNQVYEDLKRTIPFAVCPSCQGKLTEGCLTCKERGYVSEFYWKNIVTEEVRKMRAKK